MSDVDRPLLTPDQLIELENICDAFESQLAAGQPVTAESVVSQARPEIRRTLRVELDSIYRDHIAKSSSQTRTADGQTIAPDDFVFHIERIVEFSSADTNNQSTTAKNSRQEAVTDNGCFGRFQLHSIVGRGGSGVVWRAFDGNLNRWVALKIAHLHSVADSKRFVREAQAVAKLKHPNIIPVYEAGELDGRCFLVSEFCEGQPLSQLAGNQPLEIARAVEIVLDVINAVASSHHNGIIHRDIKPHNVMIDSNGIPMVTDFGLAKNLVQDQTLTLDGELIGTPGYMAPEQAKGGAQHCDERTDIYSIGVVLFQLLTGQLPFTGGFERIVFQVINSPPPRLRTLNQGLPDQLEAICAKCLEKSPERRYQSANQLGDELRRFLNGQPIETQKVTFAGRYRRWLKREPRIAWITTACVALLSIVAFGSTTSAYLLATAWRSEKRQVEKARESLETAIIAQQETSEALQRAETAESVALKNAELAQKFAIASRKEANFLSSVLAPIDFMGVNQMLAGSGDHSNLIAIETIESASRQADHLLSEVPLVQARIKGMLANAWRSHGQLDKAEAMLSESSKLLKRHSNTGDVNLLTDRAMNQLYWAYLFHHRELFETSETHYKEAIKLFRKATNQNPETETGILQLAQAEFGLGALLLRQKKNAEAKEIIERVVKTRRRLLIKGDSLLLATELAYLQCDPENSLKQLPMALQSAGDDVAQKAMVLYWSVTANRKAGLYEKATDQYAELIELIRNKVGQENWLYTLAVGDFAGLQREAGNYDQAYSNIRQAIDTSKTFARWHPQRMRAMMLTAFELKLAGRFAEAKQILQEVANHESPSWNDSVSLHSDLAWCHLRLDEPSQALVHSVSPLRIIGNCTAAETAWHCFTHATMLEANERHEKASEYFEKAITTATELVRNDQLPAHSTWLKRTGIVLTHADRHSDAELVFRRAIKYAKQEYFENHPRVADVTSLLAENLIHQQQTKEAMSLLQQVLAIQSKCLPLEDTRTVSTRQLLEKVESAH